MVLYWLAWAAVRLLATGLFRLRVSGAHHVPKTGGGPVAAAHARHPGNPLPPGSKWIRLRPIRVIYGAPVDFSTLVRELDSESKKKDVFQRISQEIMDRIAELGGVKAPYAAGRSASS